MQRETAYERANALYRNQAVPQGVLYFYIFLFDQRDLDSQQRQKILEFQAEAHNQVVPLATSLKQYCQIQEKVLKKQNSRQVPKIILVTNLTFCEEIIQLKISKESLDQLEEVYLCYKKENESTTAIINKYEIINKLVHNLNDAIVLSNQHFKNLRQTQEILNNFLIISDKKCKRRSYLIKVRAKGCIMLSQAQYEEYKQKFKKYLTRKLTLGKGENSKQFTTIMNGLQSALKLLKQKKIQEFSQQMLELYRGNVFHAVLNNGLMELTDEKFEWTQLALPFSLLYKAIRIKFYRFCLSQQQIHKIFGDKEQIILWRGGRISQKELDELKQSGQKKPFYELSSFASTSLKKQIALGFLNLKRPQQNCLMKIKLKRPTIRQEIERFSFIYQSFAVMANQQQHQILLNALTIVRLSTEKYSVTTRKQLIMGTKVQTCVIQLQIVNIESFIERYLKKDPSLTEYEKQATHHYLMTIDSIKDDQIWDIGDSLRFSGQLTAAKIYYTQKLIQLENSQIITQQQFLENKKKYHEICDKLSDICLNLNLEKESIAYSQLSIQVYKLIERLDNDKEFKEHHEYMTRKLEKHTFILQMYGHVEEARKAIEDRIKLYKKEIIQKAHLLLAYQFFMAKLLINLGLIQLRQGNYREAKRYFEESQQKVKKILKQIDYQGMKKQTFILGFIFSFFLNNKDFKLSLSLKDYTYMRRTENIELVCYIFGGQKRLKEVVSKSRCLKDQIGEFIKKKRVQDASSQNKAIKQSMLSRVKDQFQDKTTTRQLQPQFRDFFDEFQKDILKKDKSKEQKQYKHIYALLINAAEQSIQNVQEYDFLLHNCKEELIFDKLAEWKSGDYTRGSALQTKKSLERHILKLKQTQDANILKHKVESRKHYQQYLKSSINIIAEHLKHMRDYDSYHPTLETLNYRFRREELIQRQGDEVQAEAQIERIIQDAKSNPNFMLQSLQAYLLSVKLYYSIADIDFLNCLEEKVQPRKKCLEIEKMQRQVIQKCQKQLQQAAKLVQRSLRRHKRPMIDMSQEYTQARVKSQLSIREQLQERQLQERQLGSSRSQDEKLLEIDVHLNIWRVKCLIFEYNHQIQYHQKFENQLVIQRTIQTIQKKINLLSQDCRQTIMFPYFNEIMGLYRYKCNEFKQGLSYLNESFTRKPQYREIQRNFYIITKICFMYSRHKFPLNSFISQLSKSQHFTTNYPFYWRICLANHFQNKKTNSKDMNFIKQCLISIKRLQQQQRQTKHKDQNLLLKYQLIEKFEYQPMKQKYSSSILKNSLASLDTKVETSNSRISPNKKNFTLKTSKSIKSLKCFNSQIYKNQIIDLKLLNNYSQQFSSRKINNASQIYQSQKPAENKQIIPKETIRIYSARNRYEDPEKDQRAKTNLRVKLKQRKQRYLIYSQQKQKKSSNTIAIQDISIKLF